MGLSVNELFLDVIGREHDGFVIWGNPVQVREKGVYVVVADRSIVAEDISESKIEKWIEQVPRMVIYDQMASVTTLKKRLTRFIDPNEQILYIGKTDKTINERVSQFYSHVLSKPSPHRGGHWIKTISDMSLLKVYYAVVENPADVEFQMLDYYSKYITNIGHTEFYDSDCIVPFANLQKNNGCKKKHGIKNQDTRG